MRYTTYLCYLFFSTLSFAQTVGLSEISRLKSAIAIKEIDSYVKNPKLSKSIPGSFFTPIFTMQNSCSETEVVKDDRPDKTSYEVILIAHVSTDQAVTEEIEKIGFLIDTDRTGLQKLLNSDSYTHNYPENSLDTQALIKNATKGWSENKQNPNKAAFDIHSGKGRSYLVEAILQAVPALKLPEAELARQMAEVITTVYDNEEERFYLLTKIADRFYTNYNNSRNPGHNNLANNPLQKPLPKGDLTLHEITTAAAHNDEFSSGVCNDISENVALIGKIIFPDKDVLVVNAGSHFAVIVADGKKTRVIDGGDEWTLKNNLHTGPTIAVTNLRINKVENGQLKEIAKVKSQLGLMADQMFEDTQKSLQTTANISSILSHYHQTRLSSRDRFYQKSISAGTANLEDSQVVMVVAKMEKTIGKTHQYVGLGTSVQKFKQESSAKYQVHFRTGAERKWLQYLSPESKLMVELKSGVHAEVMYGAPNGEAATRGLVEVAGGLDVNNEVKLEYAPQGKKGVKINADLQATHTLGPRSWGLVSGSNSNISKEGVMATLANMNFHLNQVSADVTTAIPASDKTTALVQMNYQGSNIGQSLGALGGIKVEALNGAQILIFIGAKTAKLPGFKTQHSLLAGQPEGGQAQLQYNKKRMSLGANVQGLGQKKPMANLNVKLPLNRMTK